ncbi:colicin E3/pyocin S6 family cytotoxin [Pseudomonas sp. 10S4]|uniref:colicin E3/pyocin S6 family cytotoxin n=1 Tax=Pseudomonas sp. 10S4 TaxID=3048583 RepID=UPI002B23A047|nr:MULTISPECIES: colicin E3/pyocin S6 family cytotoxin [unclassified Pseudomonas]MEB0226513.1 colicin E3/pyocin S6 family cytotoxin [Pseudomonas sp. 5S1]MEB0295594.1 colicin E3/pyocin S6 family cytotoxin [Pseudomonas sp. 10S4]
MAGNKDIPRVKNSPSGDGHHVTHRFMTAAELAARDARQSAYDAMLARQDAFERSLTVVSSKDETVRAGCVFAKSCNLPDAIIDYSNPSGMVPTDSLKDYGEVAWLGAREVDDAGLLNLETISSTALPLGIGHIALRLPAISAAPALGVAGATVLAGLVALFWTPSLGDSALYTEDQLRALKQARTRVRLRIEQQPDGSLKGYGFYTGKNREWEMVDVVQFALRDSQRVADLGDGVELIWTPAVDGSDILGIPALEAAPQAPHIWVYPPTKAADSIIVNPVYPPEYKDFILVFPVGSGVKPVYIVLNAPQLNYHPKPTLLPAYPDAKWANPKTPIKGGGGLRPRWKDRSGTIYEWDFQHGAVEKYNKRGKHLGEFDHETGTQNKPADPTRKVEP